MLKTLRFFTAFILLFAALVANASAIDRDAINGQFTDWLNKDFYKEALKSGISAGTFSEALSTVVPNLALPDLVIPGEKPKAQRRQHQAEFSAPANYFSAKTLARLVSDGKTQLSENRGALKKIEKQYGVPASVALAIWGRETNYGSVKIPYNAFEVLATKAFMSTRKDMFKTELIAALTIVQDHYMDAASMKSSWAGALGQPQFMPTSYLKYAVDFDGDGHRNIWTSTPDTLASIANYLKLNGYKANAGWGYEVKVPETVGCFLEGPDQGKMLSEWQKLGVLPLSDKNVPALDKSRPLYLLMPEGRLGPAFLVTDNFYVLKSYNMSDLYALFIATVSDGIEGKRGFIEPWQKIDELYQSDVLNLQTKLQSQGYDIGKADGFAGFKTRRSIGLWQQKHGQKPTCFPSRSLIADIR
ncbi:MULTISPECIES: lytic murein transglycosylase [Bartonella]|uniref:lytic murein transglycosylase n=1 Tax=Bartonella TaxID=773 RepID=UPI0018DB35D9|nr:MULTISPECIES: lytic murein transglycosylase [Bartonella]MBH9995213.1 lytic murein transglycosylase [Bartonella sp. P0291]MBH9996442.1 lytic murein transglycosylase [Bartonella sp. M0192]MBH9998603.1 lytic murein transglycosylase [Bartonella sp. M0191]MBI0007928.1 lytic murein transglycosylase [Bartonella sp. M0193]MBI0009893.1 lytic murein transglycosylase [Bartonella sp. M0176]